MEVPILKSNLKLHISKLASTQSELDKLRQENEKLVSSYKDTGCVCTSTSLSMDDYKSLQNEFENFKKDHYAKRKKLQTELSYLKDLFRKLNKGKSDLNHLLSVQKHTTDKTGLGYNKKTTFSKKTKGHTSYKIHARIFDVCLKARDSLWYLDNGCPRHMMAGKSKLTDFVSKEGGYVTVATYPSAGGRRVTREMRVPRKEYVRSRHQRLFEENVGKTGKDAIYELLSERFGSCIYARGSKIGEMVAAQLAQASEVASSRSNNLLEESSRGPKMTRHDTWRGLSPVESPTVATYPSAGGRRVTRGMRVPRKEYARSRHQRLFEENVGKTGKDAIYELLSERFGSCIYARGSKIGEMVAAQLAQASQVASSRSNSLLEESSGGPNEAMSGEVVHIGKRIGLHI
ncbi:hypothetical protein HKD37_18G050889 [Glycine soja]